MKNTRTYITKTGFMKAEQCELAFFNWWNKVDEAYTPAAQGRMDEGTEVGILAQQLAPGGIDLNGLNLPPWDMARKTLELMRNRQPIYEATFITNSLPQLMCKVDMLVPDEDGWQIWEVKATSSVKVEHQKDLAFQTFVLEQCGVKVTKCALVHLNKEYQRSGQLNLQQLFIVEDISSIVREAMKELEATIIEAYKNGKLPLAPQKQIGDHCTSPYTCAYHAICWKHFPEQNNIYTIPRLGDRADYYLSRGLFNLWDLDPTILSEKQLQIWNAHMHNSIIHDHEAITAFLADKAYPYYFLDFETIMPAIPIWDNTRPYSQVPFQYSLHLVQSSGAIPKHYEFLDDASGNDPRLALCRQLIADLGTAGTIWTYNRPFEEGRIKELAILFPELATDLGNIIERLEDLITPFRNQWYYHPDMQGSNSIKAVLPVLAPDLSYDDLEIGNGGEAMDTFLRLIKGDVELVANKEEIMANLLKYCKMDTWAMVRILDALV